MLLAGRNTASALLSHALLLLARHPKEYAKARAEVLAFFEPGTPMTFETLKACKVLTYILNKRCDYCHLVLWACIAEQKETLLYRVGETRTRRNLLHFEKAISFDSHVPPPRYLGPRCGRIPAKPMERQEDGARIFALLDRSTNLSWSWVICLHLHKLHANHPNRTASAHRSKLCCCTHANDIRPNRSCRCSSTYQNKFSLLLAVQGGVKLRLHKSTTVVSNSYDGM